MGSDDASQLRDDVASCRRFDGPAGEFWKRLLQALTERTGAARAIAALGPEPGAREAGGRWKPFARWPAAAGAFALPVSLEGKEFAALSEAAIVQGTAYSHRPGGGDLSLAAVAFDPGEDGRACLGLFVLDGLDRDAVRAAAESLRSAADVPAVYREHRRLLELQGDVENIARVLDIASMVNGSERFVAAAMTLCNEAAARYGCSRVSLGWEKGNYMRMAALSGVERFDPKMDAVRRTEACMEEAADQDCEVMTPAPADAAFIAREHAACAAAGGAGSLLTLPIRRGGQPVGALTLEREDESFTDLEVAQLRVLCDQTAPRLADLRRADRWLGARAAAAIREKAGGLLGFEHTWAKIFGVLGAIALAVLVFGKAEYRVEAEFVMATDDLTHLPAPFDGYIEQAPVRVGDEVSRGDVLVALDTSQLGLEETAAVAELQRYRSEAEKAEAERRLADMRVARAMANQTEARLALIRHRIEQAEIEAPFAGVVVAGDLRDRLGAPVKAGEILMRLTRLEDLYAELKIPERDIHEAIDSTSGEIAFASRPEAKFPITIERVEPAGVAETGGNVFIARAEAGVEPQPWWRPGMTGVAKINAGRRTFLWIFTHRLVDFLRMKLWW